MNISQPIASGMKGVHFDFFLSDEIKKYSVKRITNTQTFDSLLNPNPSGLHDLSLGASGDQHCHTCNLGADSCPGHAGHIELPVPVYQPAFMSQVHRLLRVNCKYCHRFKCARIVSNLLCCRLTLLYYGYVVEAAEVENLTPERAIEDMDDDSEEEDMKARKTGKSGVQAAMNTLIQLRESFVARILRQDEVGLRRRAFAANGLSVVSARKRQYIKEFMLATSKKKCTTCKGVSPSVRKDGNLKLFEAPLTAKEVANNEAHKVGSSNALVTTLREKRKLEREQRASRRRQRHPDSPVDEAIADMHLDSHDSGEQTWLSEPESAVTSDEEEETEGASKTPSSRQTYVSSGEARASLNLLFEKEQRAARLMYGQVPVEASHGAKPLTADIFFASHIMVSPNRLRPLSRTGDNEVAEDPRNTTLKAILTRCQTIAEISHDMMVQNDMEMDEDSGARRRTSVDLMNAWVALQQAVNSLFNKDDNQAMGRAAALIPDGIKQTLEKKEGLFRMNMMGKRVNFAARSVISPDPNIETNEVGVPPVFAEKLTFPEPVTDHNYRQLAQCVTNGEHWPGASAVENERGEVINLKFKSLEERMAIAHSLLAPSDSRSNGSAGKKVYRHLHDGDIVLMNRQPTLHKPSIMGHKTRVLRQEKTLRMHYANCNTYNADFDGDEMNMHLPQNVLARSEALNIADTDRQYLSATVGKPLRGLIQDHLSVSVWMSSKDTWFNRDEYYQLLYSCLRPETDLTEGERLITIPPAIIKPRCRWSGKQVMTTILANIQPPGMPGLTMDQNTTVAGRRWGETGPEEGRVVFKEGYFVTGILDKAHLGPSSFGLVHSVYELYGAAVAGNLLGITSRLLTRYLAMRAHSCGIEDLVLTPAGNEERKRALYPAQTIGLKVATQHVSLEHNDPDEQYPELTRRLEEVLRDDAKNQGLDLVYNARTAQLTSDITTTCLPDGLRKAFPRNQMQLMTGSGAKGSPVNASLITCNLGQQVLEGRRVPVMVSGKSLPCFDPYDTHVRAGGYITDRFLTGVRPQEYFFHCMAGREGLIDTAVKTSRSGYLQRCLIKGMEGLKVHYDYSVRDTDGALIQALYGDDALDITKQMHLHKFKFVGQNADAFVRELHLNADMEAMQQFADAEAQNANESALKQYRRTGDLSASDPVLSRYPPSSWLGATSERFLQTMREYVKKNPDDLIKTSKKQREGMSKSNFRALADFKYLKSLVDPGEAVGIIAGQSIGEPSTQMTLNTFHLAGHSAKNVTLGIPRLREIVMTASAKIKTPTMTMYLNANLTKRERELFAKSISRLTLAEIIDKISVKETTNLADHKEFTVRITFFKGAEYTKHHGLQVSKVGDVLERDFVPRLHMSLRKELKQKMAEQSAAVVTHGDAQPQIGTAAKRIAGEEARVGYSAADAEGGLDDDDHDDDDDGEGDATNTKQKANKRQPISYEDAEEADDPHNLVDNEAEEDEGIGMDSFDTENEVLENGIWTRSSRENSIFSDAERPSDRAQRIMHSHDNVQNFVFDEVSGDTAEISYRFPASAVKLLAINIAERCARAAVIQQIPGIGTGTLTSEKRRNAETNVEEEHNHAVVTDGVNLYAMWEYQNAVHPHRLVTNDIHAMLSIYGVEACRATIVREMDGVFKGHGISVDYRHLGLVADYMTKGGGFSPFNRLGMRDAINSPFMKMSFETTISFLKDAVLEGERDDLTSPSARIVVGGLGGMGTGGFDVLTEVDAGP